MTADGNAMAKHVELRDLMLKGLEKSSQDSVPKWPFGRFARRVLTLFVTAT